MPGYIQSAVNSLLVKSAQTDPALVSILQEMLDELDRLGYLVEGDPSVPSKFTSPDIPPPIPPGLVNVVLHPYGIEFILEFNKGRLVYYELREGMEWETANKILVTTNNQWVIPPTTVGFHRYLIKSISIEGEYSTDYSLIDITIPPLGAVSVTTQVLADTVLLTWTQSISTFTIREYQILRDGIEIARQTGTFFAYHEPVQGLHTYTVIPIDIAGNIGPGSESSVNIIGGTDFTLLDQVDANFNTGTKFNAFILGSRLIMPVSDIETIESHFTSRGWTSPQAQVDAGYPLWLSPFAMNGYYEETFDFGILLEASRVGITYSSDTLAGSFVAGLDVSYSPDNVIWTGPFHNESVFATNFRYVKVRFSVSADDKSVMALKALRVSLSVSQENDGGFAISYSTDADGTVVSFNKPFKDVASITVTAMGSIALLAVVDFDDIPYPTSFKVKVFAGAGAGGFTPGDRVTSDIRWDARGVV